MTEHKNPVESKKKRLPVGVESFTELFENNYYYVDKTGLIVDLINKISKVTLFTRPRRFGKTLNLSMLKAFFEIGCDKSLFEGLKVSENQELCEKHMGKYPVIYLSFKDVNGETFESASNSLKSIIGYEAMRFSFLKESSRLSELDKAVYDSIVQFSTGNTSDMSLTTVRGSLKCLSDLLEKHFGKETIILIDEYDVPLDKAYEFGFYREMENLISVLFGNALKTNDSLEFAVITGCLRITKPCIYSGLNNLVFNTITDFRDGDYFGFTEKEVNEMLAYYDMTDQSDLVKEWYGGYKFGNRYIYCPWDVINFCSNLIDTKTENLNLEKDGKKVSCFHAKPKNYWTDTSSNTLVRSFLDKASVTTRYEIEQLVAGESVIKKVEENLTCNEIYNTTDNLWSALFTTGYLTVDEYLPDRYLKLRIPNRAIRQLYIEQIQEWFKAMTRSDNETLHSFCMAFLNGEAEKIEEQLDNYLWESIIFRDTSVNTPKVDFYHGLLMELLSYNEKWHIKSNTEVGDDYADICVMDYDDKIGVLIEVKYVDLTGDIDLREETFSKACDIALDQIDSKKYEEYFFDEDVDKVIKFGIAFYKKRCKVKLNLV